MAGSGCTRSTPNNSQSKGDPYELKQLDSENSPLGVHRFHGDRYRQLRCTGAGRRIASKLDHLLASASARLADVERLVYVLPAVCRQVAQRESHLKLN